MNRKLFLENFWQRYPAAPVTDGPKSWAWGRLLESSEHEFTLLQDERVIRFKWNNRTRVGGVRESLDLGAFREVLSMHDWLAVRFENDVAVELLLLAPAQAKPKPGLPRARVQEWNGFRRQVEDFFIEKGFLSVATPTLVSCPGTEPHLEPFQTALKVGSRVEKRFLPTSPELSLKKILASGVSLIFEIKPSFRNGEISEKHQPEFWMLEWYRAFANLDSIRKDVLDLIRLVSGESQLQSRTVTIAQLFQQFFAFDLRPSTTREELADLAQKKDLRISPDDSWDDVFFRLFVDFIEPNLDSKIPLFVEKYPPSQAALARLTADGWGDRFEVYWRGFEIANAYHELNDPVIQRERTVEDLRQRKTLGRVDVPMDLEFFSALESGIPPSAGIALGLERLFLAIRNENSLSSLRFFPEF